jgi:hypothetical protein
MGIAGLILANLVTLAVVVIVWSSLPNLRDARAADTKIARRGTGELGRGKTGSLKLAGLIIEKPGEIATR